MSNRTGCFGQRVDTAENGMFESQENILLLGGDCNGSFTKQYANYLKEVLKQTMMKHEATFRMQVHELHRVCRIQQTLMEDLRWKEFNRFTSWTDGPQSTSVPFEYRPDYKTPVEVRVFSTVSMVRRSSPYNNLNIKYLKHLPSDIIISQADLTQTAKPACFEKNRGTHYLRQRPLNHCGELLKDSMDRKKSLGDNHDLDVRLVRGGGNDNKESISSKLYNKWSYLSKDVVDLQKPFVKESSEGLKPIAFIDLEVPTTSNGEKRGSRISIPSDLSFSEILLDLNADQIDEPRKGTRTSASSWSKSNNSCINETSGLLQPHSVVYSIITDSEEKYSTTQVSVRNTNSRGESSKEVCIIDLESVPEDSLEPCEDFCKRGIMPIEGNADSFLGRRRSVLHDTQMDYFGVDVSSKLLLRGADLPMEVENVNCEKSEEDTLSSSTYKSCVVLQDGQNRESCPATKLGSITDENSSNMKESQPGIEDKYEVWDLNLSPMEESDTTRLGSQLAVTYSGEHGTTVESCNPSLPKDQNCDEQHQESAHVDDLVQRAAQSLLQIYLAMSVCSQDWCDNVAREELVEGQRNDQPQYSSDSFESIVLKLKESSVDDIYVTSGLTEVEETKKGLGVKMRRGRRLKDFQKDILPGLVSLSRHEIREDMHNFGEISIRNGFKKGRSKNVSGDSWCVPTRNRRTRSTRVRRKIV
ncbi:hypothetical protein GIB67_038030 [Kingdonia uniflora]|uniref:Uncharacterized protein n=1 Tax=Kingdonia uniflora TaxID=39325 RepID=A0A7J7MC01_9MAGN|nr:hypothetical protein GIB67_038030 [Kingdonia uniflora]